jgi:thioredoxin 1
MSFLSRRHFIASTAALAAASSTGALAQTASPTVKFTAANFAAAQNAGKSIVVEVSAPWCPTCRTQKPIIQSLLANPDFKDVMLLEVDFDSQKDVLAQLRVSAQSTLISYKGKTETSRSVGETRAPEIEKLFKAAI